MFLDSRVGIVAHLSYNHSLKKDKMIYIDKNGKKTFASASFSATMGMKCLWDGREITDINSAILCYDYGGYFCCMRCFEDYRNNEIKREKENEKT